MNAVELVAAIRADHWNSTLIPGKCGSLCPGPWPCAPAIAADRIEAAYALMDGGWTGIYSDHLATALDGDQ